MKRIKFLFVLFILLQYSNQLHSQEISFYYDQIIGDLSSQSEGDQLIENLTRQIWNESISSWVNDSLYEHSYNSKNLVDTIIAHKWRNGSVWGNDLKMAYSYNTDNKLILKSISEWMLSNWLENGRYYYSYSGSNQNLSQISFYYFLTTWNLEAYQVYSWNTNNYLTNVISYSLSTIFPWTYVPYWQDSLYYNLSNQLVIKTGFDYVGCDWFNDINDLYFYDQNGNNDERIRQEWNSTGGSWVNDYRYLYEYDINNVLLSIIYQDWQQDSLNWKNVWRETYTYTPQNKIITMFKDTWTQGTGWNNYVQRIYFYDLDDNWIEKITYLWDGSNWNNYYRHLAAWLVPVSVWETPHYLESYHLYNNYPNPFNPSTKIKFEIPDPGFVSLKVYDVLGNEITTLVNEEKSAGKYEVEFDGKGLSSGMYFYTLKAGNYSETKKMILIK